MPTYAGLTRNGAILMVAVLLVLLALAVPSWSRSLHRSNHQNAVSALKSLAAAEADFRINDRDGNGVNDFWTADVKGLYTLTSASVRGATDPSIKLIELPLAAADGDGTFFPAGGENVPLSAFAKARAREGYWFLAMLTDQNLKDSPRMSYLADTKGTPPMGLVHHLSQFAFLAFADSPRAGDKVFIINEFASVFDQSMLGNARVGEEVPPGRGGIDLIWQHWPEDQLLKRLFHHRECDCFPGDAELDLYRMRLQQKQ